MKQFLLIFMALLCMHTIQAQIVEDNKTFSKVELSASFPGGGAAWIKFIQDNMNPDAPDSTAPSGIHRVMVLFEIEKDGTIINVRCENDPGHGMCEEAIRVIKKSPKWIPAKINDIDAKSLQRQMIRFSIE